MALTQQQQADIVLAVNREVLKQAGKTAEQTTAAVKAREAQAVAEIVRESDAIAVFESLPNMTKEGARAMVEGRLTYSPSGEKIYR